MNKSRTLKEDNHPVKSLRKTEHLNYSKRMLYRYFI